MTPPTERLKREAELYVYHRRVADDGCGVYGPVALEAAYIAGAQAERERCAKVAEGATVECDRVDTGVIHRNAAAKLIAAAIRQGGGE